MGQFFSKKLPSEVLGRRVILELNTIINFLRNQIGPTTLIIHNMHSYTHSFFIQPKSQDIWFTRAEAELVYAHKRNNPDGFSPVASIIKERLFFPNHDGLDQHNSYKQYLTGRTAIYHIYLIILKEIRNKLALFCDNLNTDALISFTKKDLSLIGSSNFPCFEDAICRQNGKTIKNIIKFSSEDLKTLIEYNFALLKDLKSVLKQPMKSIYQYDYSVVLDRLEKEFLIIQKKLQIPINQIHLDQIERSRLCFNCDDEFNDLPESKEDHFKLSFSFYLRAIDKAALNLSTEQTRASFLNAMFLK